MGVFIACVELSSFILSASCQCSPVGSLARTCQPDTGECRCRPGVGGPMCDRCNPGYWGFPKIAEGNEGCLRELKRFNIICSEFIKYMPYYLCN